MDDAEAAGASTSFRHDAWLSAYPLTAESALAYFEWSPWYERGASNINEQLKAEGLPAAAGVGLAGVSYALRRAGGGLFVVEKRVSRGGGDAAVPVAFWAIVEGTVYPAPDLAALIAGRISRAAHHTAAAAALLAQHAADVERAAAAVAAAEEDAGDDGASAAPPHLARHVDAILAALEGPLR